MLNLPYTIWLVKGGMEYPAATADAAAPAVAVVSLAFYLSS